MKKLIFIALALIIPIIIWWVESRIAKSKGESFSGPSVMMLFGIAASIFILIVGLQLVIGGLPITIISLFLEPPNWQSISSMAIGSTIFILLIPIILCWFAWFKVIEMLPVSICTLSTLLVPIIGVISSNIILGEEIGWRELISLLLICTALALVLAPPRKHPR